MGWYSCINATKWCGVLAAVVGLGGGVGLVFALCGVACYIVCFCFGMM